MALPAPAPEFDSSGADVEKESGSLHKLRHLEKSKKKNGSAQEGQIGMRCGSCIVCNVAMRRRMRNVEEHCQQQQQPLTRYWLDSV